MYQDLAESCSAQPGPGPGFGGGIGVWNLPTEQLLPEQRSSGLIDLFMQMNGSEGKGSKIIAISISFD